MLLEKKRIVFTKSCNQKTQTGHLYEHILISSLEENMDCLGLVRDLDYELSGMTFDQNSSVLIYFSSFNNNFDEKKFSDLLFNINLSFTYDTLLKHIEIIGLEEDLDLYIGDLRILKRDLEEIHKNQWMDDAINLPYVDDYEKDSQVYLIDKKSSIKKSRLIISLKHSRGYDSNLSYILGDFLAINIGREVSKLSNGYLYRSEFDEKSKNYRIEILVSSGNKISPSLIKEIFCASLSFMNSSNLNLLIKRVNYFDFYKNMIIDTKGGFCLDFNKIQDNDFNLFSKHLSIDTIIL